MTIISKILEYICDIVGHLRLPDHPGHCCAAVSDVASVFYELVKLHF